MLDSYFAVVAKPRGLLNLAKLIDFYNYWNGIAKYAKIILIYL